MNTVLIGSQWGDEGKGKVIDVLTDKADVVVRYQGGSNAGHTVIAEGKKLHHCVGGYAKRHSKGDTAIFFIRHVTDPDISYFTLELDEKNLKVRQNRGCRNCARTDEVKLFEEKWIEHIRNLRKEENKNGNRHSKSEHNRKRGGKTAA